MGYEDRVPDLIEATGRRVAERRALWQAIGQAFEAEGAEGVERELAERMAEIEEKFDAVMKNLKDML